MTKDLKLILLLAFSGLSGAFAQTREVSIIPKPASMQLSEGKFLLSPSVPLVAKTPAARKNAELFNVFLSNRYGFTLPVSFFDVVGSSIVLDDSQNTDEAYSLKVSPSSVDIKGGNAGVFYALQSLLQAIEEQDGTLAVPALSIDDKPEFGYRGLMLDVSRHFFPLAELKKIVDMMAYLKFNRLHWHLTEDQGWRLEIKKYPKLTQISSFRDSSIIGFHYDNKPFVYDGKKHGGYYTQDEARELVKYAADRHITIMPEIELPGHSTAALAAYPELGNRDTTYQVPGYWGVYPFIYAPKEETFKFLEDVLTEVMDIFPSEYIHIGGDEVPKEHWKTSDLAQKLIKKHKLEDEHGLQSYFIRHIEKFLNAHGRRLVGWDEILEGGLAPNATVMSWRGEAGGIAAARQNHDVIMTPNSHLYLDHKQSKDQADEPVSIGGFLPLEKVYSYHPRPDSLSADQQKHILGVQANLWTEYITTANHLEYMLFPRALALAEVAWTSNSAKDYTDFSQKRLPKRLQELETLGYLYRIPEAAVSFGKASNGRKTITLKPFVANSKIYYTVDGYKADLTSALYDGGAIELPWYHDKMKYAPVLNYIVVTPDNRVSNMFSIPLMEEAKK
ncbi:beta-N-acetylhexosaminidase [Olivibacter sitiensis]|uniref:beta-N-acetylhexosaminidase n=1 Tax=Olivibacter sitiensis TaxID=376470 RepID=UPI00048329C7|nr:beta-N-acetylhexosaminidase [Olivibacter sitiensis]